MKTRAEIERDLAGFQSVMRQSADENVTAAARELAHGALLALADCELAEDLDASPLFDEIVRKAEAKSKTLLARLGRAGIHCRLTADGKLVIGPRQLLTASLVAGLRRRQRQLMEELSNGVSD